MCIERLHIEILTRMYISAQDVEILLSYQNKRNIMKTIEEKVKDATEYIEDTIWATKYDMENLKRSGLRYEEGYYDGLEFMINRLQHVNNLLKGE